MQKASDSWHEIQQQLCQYRRAFLAEKEDTFRRPEQKKEEDEAERAEEGKNEYHHTKSCGSSKLKMRLCD